MPGNRAYNASQRDLCCGVRAGAARDRRSNMRQVEAAGEASREGRAGAVLVFLVFSFKNTGSQTNKKEMAL